MIYVSADADQRLKTWLSERYPSVRELRTEGIVSEPLSCHPDMFMCKMGVSEDAEIISYFTQNETRLSPEYPADIAFNAACTGRFFIHNLKYTAPVLLKRAEELNLEMVDVRQGYAKCSTVIVDEDSVITYDRGLGKSCAEAGMEVLMISPGNILLPGYNTGFIGGASGRTGDTVVFNGDLSAHPDFDMIVRFIEERGLKVKWFPEWLLTDTGSIISRHPERQYR